MSGSSDSSTPDCSFNSLTGASYAIFVNLTTSAPSAVSGASGTVQGTAKINGFNVPLLSANGTSACSGFVDTGNNQYLSVQANGTGQIPVSQLCQLVQPAIKIVLDNLTVLQP